MPVIMQSIGRRSEMEKAAQTDAVSKFRVCTPESLIDTDFEYGLQSSKWETLELINNIPTFFTRSGDMDIGMSAVVSVSGSYLITVTTSFAHGFIVGSPFTIQGLRSLSAEGIFFVISTPTPTQFVYKAKSSQNFTGSIFDLHSSSLYPARIFQGTQYNLDSIRSMETDEGALSKILVKTIYPHGFGPGTNFMLINSVGNKRITFDASLIDPTEYLVQHVDIVTADMNVNGGGLTSKYVNPYDWTSLKALYFSHTNVNTTASYINYTAHGLATGDTVMYVCPIGDTCIDGLVNYQAYNVVVVDQNNIYLTDIVPTENSGLYYYLYNGGFYNNNPYWFTSQSPSSTGLCTSTSDITSSFTKKSVEVLGYFVPDITETWTFYLLGTNGSSFLWFGDQAIEGYTTSNCSISNPGGQVPIEVSYSVGLVAGVRYPLRIQLGTNSAGELPTFSFAGPDQIKKTNGEGFFYCDSVPTTASPNKTMMTSQGTTYYGYHTLMKVYLVNGATTMLGTLTIGMHTGNYTNSSLIANSPIAMFSRDVYKRNFGVSNFKMSSSNISRSQYTKYYIKGNPVVGTESTPLQVTTSPNGATSNITTEHIHGVTWIIPLATIEEYDCFFSPGHGFSTDDEVSFSVVSGVGPAGVTDGNTYYVERVNNSAFRVKAYPGAAETEDILNIGNGTVRFTKTIVNPMANTIYSAGHDLPNGSPVIYDANGNTSVQGISEGEVYYVINATDNTFALSTIEGSHEGIVNITGASTGMHYITCNLKATDGHYKIGNITDAYSFTLDASFKIPSVKLTIDPRRHIVLSTACIYKSDHKLRTGTRVYYTDNGNTAIGGLASNTDYYAIRVDTSHFQLATTLENAKDGVFVPFTSHGTGDDHIINIYDVGGEICIPNSIYLTVGSNIVKNNGSVDFTGFTKYGDSFYVEIANPVNTSIAISSIDTDTHTITLESNHGLSDGNHIVYESSTPATGLTSGYVYYVRTTGYNANQLALYALYTDSQSGINKVAIQDNTPGFIVKRFAGSVFQSTVTEVKSQTTLAISLNAPATTTGNFILTTGLFPRTDGYALHRAHDGGIEIIPSSSPDSQIIRQTKKYFRYQPGKGIQVSNSINFSAPTYIISLNRTGTTAYATTRKPHRVMVNDIIILSGVTQLQQGDDYWNGTYQVTSTPDVNVFTFTLRSVPTETVAGGYPAFILNSWVNSKIRVGLFDDQNGMFYEYDGMNLYAVRRDSVHQVPGTCEVWFNSALVRGSLTSYTTNLVCGDMIVLKGQSYKVVHIANNNNIYIQPPYRGISATNVVMLKTSNTKVPQSQWSIDVCDGEGPTGFHLDINKIQMTYIDYSWYGAGKIRFGFKATNGEVRYMHEFVHNNTNTEAYMRSGNLPARYEVVANGAPSFCPSLLHWGTAIIMDGKFNEDRSYLFTATGGQITYAQNDSLQFVIRVTSNDTTATFPIYDPTQGKKVDAYRITTTVYTVVHNIKPGTLLQGNGLQTGTRIIATTKANDSAGYLFIDRVPSVVANSTVTAGDLTASDNISPSIPLISIRLSPSVDTGFSGSLGSREVLNRMQLVLKSVGILTTHDCEIQLLLNAHPYTKTWTRVTSPSFCQLIHHAKGDSVSGGTQIYNFRVSGGVPDVMGKRYSVNNVTPLDGLSTLGNSILGGDDVYPNGPELLTVCANVLDTTGITVTTPFAITGRLTWTEAQA